MTWLMCVYVTCFQFACDWCARIASSVGRLMGLGPETFPLTGGERVCNTMLGTSHVFACMYSSISYYIYHILYALLHALHRHTTQNTRATDTADITKCMHARAHTKAHQRRYQNLSQISLMVSARVVASAFTCFGRRAPPGALL